MIIKHWNADILKDVYKVLGSDLPKGLFFAVLRFEEDGTITLIEHRKFIEDNGDNSEEQAVHENLAEIVHFRADLGNRLVIACDPNIPVTGNESTAFAESVTCPGCQKLILDAKPKG